MRGVDVACVQRLECRERAQLSHLAGGEGPGSLDDLYASGRARRGPPDGDAEQVVHAVFV